ncbi:hypothetical protein JXA88_02340 [Candidatus Fermentibacteria bacterium]|nr:hypothetical protein [Candidatus Fermentibacteria bacterium]
MTSDIHTRSRRLRQGVAVEALACFLAGSALAAGFSSAPAGAQFVGVAVAATLFLRRRVPEADGIPMMALAAAVAFHTRVVSTALWNQHPSMLSPLWARLTDIILLGLVVSCAHRSSRSIRLLAALLIVGIPSQPAGYVWATFPVACLLLVDGSSGGLRWACIVFTGWICFELARAPCRLDAALAVASLVLAYAGFQSGRSLSGSQSWLRWLGLTLAAPMLLGWLASVSTDETLSVVGWGVNRNPLAAQTAIGVLLIYLSLRPRHRITAWIVLMAGLVVVAAAQSVWALACLALVVGASVAPRGVRSGAILGLGVIPIVTPLAVMVSLPALPHRLLVSCLARQFHWRAALRYMAHFPWGGGLGPVHPQALDLVSSPPELSAIPGVQMQHSHHLLLHIGEQSGVVPALLMAVLALWWCLRLAREQNPHPAGFGLLYLWLNNGADLTLLSETLMLAGGVMLGVWMAQGLMPRRGLWPAILALPFGAVWLSSLIVASTAERASRGMGESRLASGTVKAILAALWDPVVLSPGPTGTAEPTVFHGRCAYLTPALVEQARPYIARWQPDTAESLLVEAIRLDPTGVVPGGGGRARALLAMIQGHTRRGPRSKETLAGIHWAEAEAIQAYGALDFFSLRRRSAKVDSLISYIIRTSEDPQLVARFSREKARRWSQRDQGVRSAQDIIKEEIERMLASGLVGAAKVRLEARDTSVEPWLQTMLWSKVAVAEGDMPRAVALASRAVVQSGGSDAARWELVGILSQSNRSAEALVEAGRLLARRPEDPAMWLLRAKTLLDAGRAAEALADLDRARSLGADVVACGIARSQAFRMVGKGTEARRLLIGLVNGHPETAWPAWELASWAESEERLGEAGRWATMALERSPGDHGSRVLLGRVLAKTGRLKEAWHHLKLVADDPRAGPGWQADARHELELLKGRLDG